MEPVLAQLEEEYGDRVDFKSYNTWDEREKVSQYGITVTPTYLFLDKDGKVVSRLTGQQPLSTMRSHIEKSLGE